MKLRLCSVALAFFALAPLTAFADIPAPEPKPAATPRAAKRVLPPARMLIESRTDATEARLQISQSVLRELRSEFERDAASDAAAVSAGSSRQSQTIIAGVFLSLSLAFAGVFLARSRSRATKQVAVGVLVVFAVAGAFTFKALANARPPEPRIVDAGTLPHATTPDEELNGVVRVEIVPDGRVIKLIVPAAKTGSE
ncbi:MAG TPA: hypothetical protein VGO96_10065 [Pyrinomonadaceae bacterium]|jgi:hypothetical protein|nr:hypothetical protein [Pyrinomonadaceae bacterium]